MTIEAQAGDVCSACSATIHIDGSCPICMTVETQGRREVVPPPLTIRAHGTAVANRITDHMGLERVEGFSISRLFSETFRHHSELELEDLLMVGGQRTTPSLRNIMTDWPTPWMFARMLTASLAVFAVLWFSWQSFENVNLIPGLVIVGAFAIPLSLALFFFEMNVVRNVSLLLVMKLVFLGGVVSLLAALILFEMSDGLIWWLGASSAGIVEECAKLATVLLIIRGSLGQRYPHILNGILFGAAVGTGFAAFESAGYALRIGLLVGSDDMVDNIIGRGMLSPLGHIAWTAIAAGALWRVKGAAPFRWDMLTDKRAYSPLLLVIGLHFLWNTPFTLPLHAKYLALGAVAWLVVIALIQAGLRQVAQQKAHLAELESALLAAPASHVSEPSARPRLS